MTGSAQKVMEELGVPKGVYYEKGMSVDELEKVAGRLGLSVDAVRGEGVGGEEYRHRLRKEVKYELPLQKEIVLTAVLLGLDNDEVAEAVHRVYPKSSFKAEYTPVVWHVERRENSEWWQKNRDRLAEVRNLFKLEGG